jgi:hypothetical protein
MSAASMAAGPPPASSVMLASSSHTGWDPKPDRNKTEFIYEYVIYKLKAISYIHMLANFLRTAKVRVS